MVTRIIQKFDLPGSVNELNRTALTCGISKGRRSGHDRNDLDTVEVRLLTA
jgi:hypothetical protein